jgi:hypothetical protein
MDWVWILEGWSDDPNFLGHAQPVRMDYNKKVNASPTEPRLAPGSCRVQCEHLPGLGDFSFNFIDSK